MSGVAHYLSHFLCPFFVKHKKIKAVSGDLPGEGGAILHLLQLLSPDSLSSHKLQLEEHHMSDDQTCRIWVDSHAWDTRLHTTLPASQGSKQKFGLSLLILPGRWGGAKSSAAQIQHLPTCTFFLRRTRGRIFAGNIFCLPWLQPYYLSGFSLLQSVSSQKRLMSRR